MQRLAVMLIIGATWMSGCATGPENIFTVFEKRYWRIDSRETPDSKWKTNWMSWFETEEACLAAIDETQRCRVHRM
jgi:hypothetical protein